MLDVAVKSNGLCRSARQSWIWTWGRTRAVVARMDDDTDSQDLVDQLSTRIGMIMEDTCLVALNLAPRGDPARYEAIDDLDHAAKQIAALVGAIRALGG